MPRLTTRGPVSRPNTSILRAQCAPRAAKPVSPQPQRPQPMLGAEPRWHGRTRLLPWARPARIENLVFSIYAAAEGRPPRRGPVAPHRQHACRSRCGRPHRRGAQGAAAMITLADLRTLDSPAVAQTASCTAAGAPAPLVTASQAAQLGAALSDNAVITVPDFLNYARLINTGQAGALVGLAGGMGGFARAGIAASPAVLGNLPRAARKDFWVVAEALVRFDLSLIPASFRGTVMLHSYLTDFAIVFEQSHFVRAFFRIAGRVSGRDCTPSSFRSRSAASRGGESPPRRSPSSRLRPGRWPGRPWLRRAGSRPWPTHAHRGFFQPSGRHADP